MKKPHGVGNISAHQLDDIDLEQLLASDDVRGYFQAAQQQHAEGNYQTALEWLGYAFYLTLYRFPGIGVPITAKRSPEHALLLSVYGVRPVDFLSLQEFLPCMFERGPTPPRKLNCTTNGIAVERATRRTGTSKVCAFASIRFSISH